mmetsp:Transcript_8288/g.9500  ORF Transcript_8288/g.9500 Transcript_8288/m.9500 type:complete len:225 (+) Transcript_8288:369-1043(+)
MRRARQWSFHGPTVGIVPGLGRGAAHESIGKMASGRQSWNATLTLLAIFHTTSTRSFPELVFLHAVKLNAIGYTYSGAATNCIPCRFQSFHGDVVDIALCFNGHNLIIILLAASREVGSVAISAHRPSTPLLMRNDHAPLISSTNTPVTITVCNLGHRTLPIVTCHLDEVSSSSGMNLTIMDIGQGHGSFAAACSEGVGIPHLTCCTVVPFTRATPNARLIELR